MAGAPNEPDPVAFSNLSDTSVRATSRLNGQNGSAVDRWQLGYGRDWNSPVNYVDMSEYGAVDVRGLWRGTTYYFWARVHNRYGWSSWSSRRSIKTHDFPGPPGKPSFSNVTTSSALVSFKDGSTGGTPILERRIGYGTGSSAEIAKNYDGPTTISGLVPGARYRVWSRVRNSVGWSEWSSYGTLYPDATSRVFYDGRWENAVAYVRVGGVWKPARPMIKIAGMWKPGG